MINTAALKALGVAWCMFICLTAQADLGSIEGTVVDKSLGKVLPGATVRLLPHGTLTTTNSLGRFEFHGIHEGHYQVVITYTGFAADTSEVVVEDHRTARVEAVLEVSVVELADATIVASRSGTQTQISRLDLILRPVFSSQDMLRLVPGLMIAQHAGGGKAEQIFLRGFDMDHGTDIAISVDGIPVNLVSHAHGQGYSDLHFIIPELISNVGFEKGPYDVNSGNFSTGGSVSLETMQQVTESRIKLEGGSFGSLRGVGLFDLTNRENPNGNSAYIASEYTSTQGYFERPLQFRRLNTALRINRWIADRKYLTISGGTFSSSWVASGQIPQRAVQSGQITRFGHLDQEQGEVARSYASLNLSQTTGKNTLLTNQVYVVKNDFDLYSNFTFFLEDPINGDRIRQQEDRIYGGYNGSLLTHKNILGVRSTLKLGTQIRLDQIRDISLTKVDSSDAMIGFIESGDIYETNAGTFGTATIEVSDELKLITGIRYDHFLFEYDRASSSTRNASFSDGGFVSGHAGMDYQFSGSGMLFIRGGRSFHSNDARSASFTGTREGLAGAYGLDVGTFLKPLKNMLLQVSAWALWMEDELVYSGDAGIVERSGRTFRRGIDLSVRQQILKFLYADLDVTATEAVLVSEPEGVNNVPLAPGLTATGGLRANLLKKFHMAVRMRHIADRPANKDGSLTAEGYLILDGSVIYQAERFELSLNAVNLLNETWNEAQFETESRLRHESGPFNEIHFTPGTPFGVFAGAAVKF